MDVEKKPGEERDLQNSSSYASSEGVWEKKVLTGYRPYSHWYDGFRPSSFQEPKASELDFDSQGMSRTDIAQERLSRSTPALKRRHITMIAASSCVGTGLFIGSGSTLAAGGPAALLIGFAVPGIALLLTIQNTSELSLRYPTVSPFSQLSTKFLDSSWGFSLGWLYAFQWMVTGPLELIAAAMLTQYQTWQEADTGGAGVNPVAWVAILYFFELCVHLFGGSLGYAELEFFIACIKVTATLAWIIYSIIYNAGGIPGHGYIGGHYYYDPGAFFNGFKGVANVMVSAAFAYAGTEVSALAAAETANPVRAIPSTTRQTFWRIIVFFVVAICMVGLTVPYNIGNLGSSTEGSGSPFVRMLELAGTHALPTLMNAVVMFSVFGVSNAAIYAGSRTLVALSVSGNGPKFLSYIDRRGRPLIAQCCMLTFALLCFVSASSKYNDVFNWLYAFVELVAMYVWASINFCHIKFRLAWRYNNRSTSELLYAAPLGIYGSVIAGSILVFIIGINFWTAAAPPLPEGGSQLTTSGRVQNFFQQNLSVPFGLVIYAIHKIYWKKKYNNWGYVGVKDIDLDEGVRDIDYDVVEAENERARERGRKNFLIRLGHIFC